MMKIRFKGILAFLCVFLLAIPAGALDASLGGRWISLQYGSLTFSQTGDAFTAVWTNTNAAGTISGRQASFRFWAGSSFEKCKDDSRGYGTLTLSVDGNTLSGSWASLSKKEPESGSFTALRLSSITESLSQDAAPATQEDPGAGITATDPALPASSPMPGASTLPAGTGLTGDGLILATDAAFQLPDELILTEDLPPEYIAPVMELISDIEESVLNFLDFFDEGSDPEAETSPLAVDELILTEDLPPEYIAPAMEFFSDIGESVLNFFGLFDD